MAGSMLRVFGMVSPFALPTITPVPIRIMAGNLLLNMCISFVNRKQAQAK